MTARWRFGTKIVEVRSLLWVLLKDTWSLKIFLETFFSLLSKVTHVLPLSSHLVVQRWYQKKKKRKKKARERDDTKMPQSLLSLWLAAITTVSCCTDTFLRAPIYLALMFILPDVPQLVLMCDAQNVWEREQELLFLNSFFKDQNESLSSWWDEVELG